MDDFGGADAVEQTLRLARSTRALPYLLDTGNWISYDEAVALWDAGRRVTHHPQFARAVGEDATRRLRTSPVADLLRSLGSPEAVYRQMAIASARFSTVSTFETVTADPGCAEIRSLPVDGFPRHPDHCAWTCGLVTTTPPLFGLAPALVEHNECVSYGASSCLYRITWNVAEEPANGDSTGQISALRDQLDAMRERLRNMFETASDLIGPDELTDVLARITDRAAVEVRAPRYLLAVRATPEGEMHRHHKGFEPHQAAAHADRILSEDPAGLPASWLVVPIASHRCEITETAIAADQPVAEGVENEETLELLEQLSVDYAQGFWIGRPKPLVPVDPEAELDRHSARVGVSRPELEGVGQ